MPPEAPPILARPARQVRCADHGPSFDVWIICTHATTTPLLELVVHHPKMMGLESFTPGFVPSVTCPACEVKHNADDARNEHLVLACGKCVRGHFGAVLP